MTLAYFWGEDAYALDEAAREVVAGIGASTGPVELRRVTVDETDAEGAGTRGGTRAARALAEIEQGVGTATLFASGTVVLVRQPASLVRDASSRERLLRVVPHVAPGNGLVFVELVESMRDRPKSTDVVRQAVLNARGTVREFPALTRDRMEGWIVRRAEALGTRMGAGAARLLAERVGAYVREGDVDRRRQSQLANAELEKLSLYRAGATVTRTDVEELVTEAVPGSLWGLLDAVGERRGPLAASSAARLESNGMPLQVVVSQLHRRLRELISVRELLAAGHRPPEIARLLRLQPFRATKLTEQAATWTLTELEAGLAALLELDLLSKGIARDGSTLTVSDERSWLGFWRWLGEHVARGAA